MNTPKHRLVNDKGLNCYVCLLYEIAHVSDECLRSQCRSPSDAAINEIRVVIPINYLIPRPTNEYAQGGYAQDK